LEPRGRSSKSGHAIVTGGSSGIGLAAARHFARRGISVSLIARNVERLKRAQCEVEKVAVGDAAVAVFSADVGNTEACRKAIEESVTLSGPPTWAVASAGIVLPGKFLDLPLEAHEMQARTNYFGSLNFAYHIVPLLVKAGGGRMIFVSSGAAFLGIYGYSSYGPSKFAVRGLAETLRVELQSHNVSVTIVYPPDTNTPQLVAEIPLRPAPTSVITSASGLWEPEDVANAMILGAERGRFMVVPGWRLGLLNRVHSMIAPAFRSYQSWVVKRHGYL
jgi:3-dehydrosphinganine reductase